jgi:cell wall assembly regulator SMI1
MIARRIVARFLAATNQVSMEFNTPEAMQKYLKEHPKADPANHHVKKDKDKGTGKSKKLLRLPEEHSWWEDLPESHARSDEEIEKERHKWDTFDPNDRLKKKLPGIFGY